MLIDCDHCAARPAACGDCVVGVLLGTPDVPARDTPADAPSGSPSGAAPREPGGPLPVEFGPVEQRALEVLADHGLIPRLRLVAPPEPTAAGPDTVAGPATTHGGHARGRAADRTRDVG